MFWWTSLQINLVEGILVSVLLHIWTEQCFETILIQLSEKCSVDCGATHRGVKGAHGRTSVVWASYDIFLALAALPCTEDTLCLTLHGGHWLYSVRPLRNNVHCRRCDGVHLFIVAQEVRRDISDQGPEQTQRKHCFSSIEQILRDLHFSKHDSFHCPWNIWFCL